MRHVRPTRRYLNYITATNIRHMWGIADSGHSQYLDVLHRSHAGVEDRGRTDKAMGLANLLSASREVNRGWVLAASLASDLDAWVRRVCTASGSVP
ncbi:hypothetical protein ACFUCH_08320 [Streptomyces olivaceus]|uniref:hypothetical protein n=1 Tax=Streptomyces olivaceus TaxID=47716 RepID=UPI00363DFAD7